MTLLTYLLFGLLTFITQCIEAVTGFGSTVTALPFGIALVGLTNARPVFAGTSLVMCLYIAIRERHHIAWKVYALIIAFVLVGMPVGMWAFSSFDDVTLRRILGVVVFLIALRGLYFQLRNKTYDMTASGQPKIGLNCLWLIVGGMVHGAFVSGGPFIIVYAAKALQDKSVFRATMCMIWVTLNIIVAVQDISQGHFTPFVLRLLVVSFLFTIASVYVGNILHRKCKPETFTTLVYIILLLSGAFMVINSLM